MLPGNYIVGAPRLLAWIALNLRCPTSREAVFMKKLLLLSSALVISGQATAADLPVKAPPMAVTAPYSWTGCHIGGHVGAGWDRSTYSDPGTFVPVPGFATQN